MSCVGVGLDPKDGLLSLPGTVAAAVFGGVMDVESGGMGVGDAPSSGPSATPAKVPVVYLYGRRKVEEESSAWREVGRRLAGTVKGRMQADEAVRRAGVVVDVPSLGVGKDGVELLAGVVGDFDVNVVVVLGSARLNAELTKRLAGARTNLGEEVAVVALDRSEGVVEMDDGFLQQVREAAIKEYFFGSFKRTLSPATQQVDFGAVSIYRIPEGMSTGSPSPHSRDCMANYYSIRVPRGRRSPRESRTSHGNGPLDSGSDERICQGLSRHHPLGERHGLRLRRRR